jgi:hypothetical protein
MVPLLCSVTVSYHACSNETFWRPLGGGGLRLEMEGHRGTIYPTPALAIGFPPQRSCCWNQCTITALLPSSNPNLQPFRSYLTGHNTYNSQSDRSELYGVSPTTSSIPWTGIFAQHNDTVHKYAKTLSLMVVCWSHSVHINTIHWWWCHGSWMLAAASSWDRFWTWNTGY